MFQESVVCFLLCFCLLLIVPKGESFESAPVVAGWSNYPYAVGSVTADTFWSIALAVSKKYILLNWNAFPGLRSRGEVDLVNMLFDIYKGDPKISTQFAYIGNVTGEYTVVIFKLCDRLPISQGMALTPSKFIDYSSETPGKVVFFSYEDNELYYVNVTVLKNADCPAELLKGTAPTGNTFDPIMQSCIKYMMTLQWDSDDTGDHFSDGLLIVNNHPQGFLTESVCNTASRPYTLDSAPTFVQIQTARTGILEFTGGEVDQA